MTSPTSSGSRSTTSGPPPASSWAAPPEFYLDENIAGRTIARGLRDLSYAVHTPSELYGSREAAEGVRDETWLAEVGARGWVAVSRDTKILQRPDELAAYRAARLHMVLFPRQATRQQLIEALHDTLAAICTSTARARPDVWRVHRDSGRWALTEMGRAGDR